LRRMRSMKLRVGAVTVKGMSAENGKWPKI
jgi:hypothetical protein